MHTCKIICYSLFRFIYFICCLLFYHHQFCIILLVIRYIWSYAIPWILCACRYPSYCGSNIWPKNTLPELEFGTHHIVDQIYFGLLNWFFICAAFFHIGDIDFCVYYLFFFSLAFTWMSMQLLCLCTYRQQSNHAVWFCIPVVSFFVFTL